MPDDLKISAMTPITGANLAADDVIPVVDVSTSTNRNITRDEYLSEVKRVIFSRTNYDAAPEEGVLTWDADEKTLSLGLNGGDTVLQIGQESHIRVRNNSGALIANGTVVMQVGTVGNSGRLTIAKAVADGSVDGHRILGITTEDIANGADGLVTNFGKVRQINTTAFADGAVLYANPAVPGGMTATRPAHPNAVVVVAFVVHSHSIGTLFVHPSYESQPEMVTLTGTQTLTNKTLASPALTGTPTAPTAAQGTNTTQVATTEFVVSELDTALTDTFAPMLGGDLIFNVPAQYPTIQAAVDAALRYVTSGYRLEVKIASGHALTHGIRLVGAQASGIKITSVDAVVHIAPGFVPVDSNEWPASSHALAAFVDTDPPLWNILVDLTGTSGVDGMMVFGRSRAQVGPTWGVNNGRCNLEVRGGAEIVAPGSNWNGASNENIRITSGARAELRDSTAHDGWQFGAAGISYMYGSVLVSRGSVANLQGIKIYRPRASAISVRRSFISMKYADIQELSYGGFITTGTAIHIHDGSIISAATVTVDGVPMTRLHTSTGLIGCMTEDGVIFDGVSTGLDSGLTLNDGSQKVDYSKVLWWDGDADPATFPGDGGSRFWPSLNLQRQIGDSTEVRLYFQRFDGRNLSFVRTWGSDNVMTTARYLLDNDLTATATDSTAGLVLKTGDAGILGRIDTPNIDLDAEYFGFWGNASTSEPPVVRPDGLTGNSRWAGLTLGNHNSRLQLARRTDATNRLYVRSRDYAAWSDWSEILTAARILSSIASTPAFVGQQAFVNGVEYRAFGIASTADWVPVASANRSGTTANRPTTQLFVGRQYFDTDLNKPIWRNAANSGWVDAVGATV